MNIKNLLRLYQIKPITEFTGGKMKPWLLLWVMPTLVAAQTIDGKSLLQPPTGWHIESEAKGDLNGDQQPDVAIILKKDEMVEFKGDDDGLRGYPRRLVVLLSSKEGYQQALQTKNTLIPYDPDSEQTCLMDPLEDLAIRQNHLWLSLSHWYGCGSWWREDTTWQIRYKQGIFELIGQESKGFHRASQEQHWESINYLTAKVKITETPPEESRERKPKTYWRSLDKSERPATLDLSKLNELP